jgi:hypothetical protein
MASEEEVNIILFKPTPAAILTNVFENRLARAPVGMAFQRKRQAEV